MSHASLFIDRVRVTVTTSSKMSVKFRLPHLYHPSSTKKAPEPEERNVPAILQDPVAIKIYGLDDSTFLSALTEARQILADVTSFSHLGKQVTFQPDLFILEPDTPLKEQWSQDTATLRYDPALYKSVEDRPDESLLRSLAAHLYALGYDAFWSPTSRFDRSTNFKFRASAQGGKGTPDPFAGSSHTQIGKLVSQLFHSQGFQIPQSNITSIKVQHRRATGALRCSDRTQAEALQLRDAIEGATQSENGEVKLKIVCQPNLQTVPVTSCTTLVLWLELRWLQIPQLRDDANRLIQLAAESLHLSEEVGGSNFRLSPCRKYFCFDPDTTLLAMEISKLPAFNGFFYESAYMLNSEPASDGARRAWTARLAKQKAYDEARGRPSPD